MRWEQKWPSFIPSQNIHLSVQTSLRLSLSLCYNLLPRDGWSQLCQTVILKDETCKSPYINRYIMNITDIQLVWNKYLLFWALKIFAFFVTIAYPTHSDIKYFYLLWKSFLNIWSSLFWICCFWNSFLLILDISSEIDTAPQLIIFYIIIMI